MDLEKKHASRVDSLMQQDTPACGVVALALAFKLPICFFSECERSSSQQAARYNSCSSYATDIAKRLSTC